VIRPIVDRPRAPLTPGELIGAGDGRFITAENSVTNPPKLVVDLPSDPLKK
jgi:hypothetical protein